MVTGRSSVRGRADLLAHHVGVVETTDVLADVVRAAIAVAWTRDTFDRLIVATAMLHRAPLVTRDARIRAHFPDAVW